MKLKKTKEGMVVMSKDRLTKDSKWPHPVHVVCEKGLKLHQNNCDMKHAKPSARETYLLRTLT